MGLIKIVAAITIACVSFFISKSITNSIIPFGHGGPGNWLVDLFLLAPLYLVVFSALMGVIGFGAWNLLSYLLIRGARVSASSIDPKAHQKPTRSMPSPAAFIGRTLLGTMALVGGALIIIVVGMLSFVELADHASKSTQEKYEKSFEIVYPNINFYDETYNALAVEIAKTDVRVIFYKRELEIVTGNFTEADNAYSIFESDVKREFALSCMVKIFSETMRIGFNGVEGFKKNARNEYVRATNSKARYMKNDTLIKDSSGVYNYPLSTGYGTYKLDHDFPNRCDEMMSVDIMYDKFIPIYIEDKKDQANKDLARKDESSNPRSITASTNKIFSWIKTIRKEALISE